MLGVSLGVFIGLNPSAHPRTPPKTTQKAERATLGIGAIVLAHDWLDGFSSLVCMVEGNCADEMMQDMGLDDAMEEMSADESELAVDCRGGSSGKVPGFRTVVR